MRCAYHKCRLPVQFDKEVVVLVNNKPVHLACVIAVCSELRQQIPEPQPQSPPVSATKAR